MAMGVAMAAGLGVGLAALAVDTAWFWPPPVELGTIAGARVLLGSVTSGLITVAVFGLWMRTVVVGLMAAHFSPRTLLIFLDDRFQRNLLAFMSAGVVAVLVILLRMPTDEQAAKRYDEASALLAYQSSLRAISEIGELAQEVGDVDFATCDSLYYASNCTDLSSLADEFAWRKQHSFPVRWLSRAALKDEYELKAPAAICLAQVGCAHRSNGARIH
ncbi:DUF2254 family protein [Marinobacter guineae]|nr:DUF2254 family protein [Marinobacter guineae]